MRSHNGQPEFNPIKRNITYSGAMWAYCYHVFPTDESIFSRKIWKIMDFGVFCYITKLYTCECNRMLYVRFFIVMVFFRVSCNSTSIALRMVVIKTNTGKYLSIDFCWRYSMVSLIFGIYSILSWFLMKFVVYLHFVNYFKTL